MPLLPAPAAMPALAERRAPVGGHPARWAETLALAGGGLAVVALLSRKAFSAYFSSEAFVYLGSYLAAGRSFGGAVFAPHGDVFFRPTLWAANLPWNLLLPPDTLLYHLRNLAFIGVALVLLHRVMLRLVPSRGARGVALLAYASSKLHLTTIGYVATFSTILLIVLTLSALLAYLRFIENGSLIDRLAALGLVLLTVFSKDYGVVIVIPLAALWWARDGRRPRRFAFEWLVPAGAIFVAYLALRLTIVGGLPRSGPYQPRLEAFTTARKLATGAATLGNFSLVEWDRITGARGVTRWLVSPRATTAAILVEDLAALAFLAVFLGTVVAARRAGRPLVVPIAWGAAFFLPTLLTRNIQMYYYNDAMAAAAMLLGIALAHLPRRWTLAWAALVCLAAANAEASQEDMRYLWLDCARQAEGIRPIVARYRDAGVSTIVFLTDHPTEWRFALDADGHGAMLSELFGHDIRAAFEPLRSRPREPLPSGIIAVEPDRGFAVVGGARP